MIYGKKAMAGRKTRKKRRKARHVQTLEGLPPDEWRRYHDGDLRHLSLLEASIQIRSEALRWISLARGADQFGYWRTCPFPVCRRHRKCVAEYWPKGEPVQALVHRPPCCHRDESRYERLTTFIREKAARKG